MPYYYNFNKKKKKKDKPLPLFDTAGVKVKKKTDYKAKLDKEFSLFIRRRDSTSNGYFRCISCGQIKKFEQADCGHFFSRTHMSTRWDEDNCHAECARCNRFVADHLVGYQRNLVTKIGQMRYDKLVWKASQTKHWTDFELQELIKHYKALNAKLKKEKGF